MNKDEIIKILHDTSNVTYSNDGVTTNILFSDQADAILKYLENTRPSRDEVSDKRERLAEYAHNAWSGWMKYMFSKSTINEDGTLTIPQWAVERWQRQMNTPYNELPEEEKASDRHEADLIIDIATHPTTSQIVEAVMKLDRWECDCDGLPMSDKYGRYLEYDDVIDAINNLKQNL